MKVIIIKLSRIANVRSAKAQPPFVEVAGKVFYVAGHGVARCEGISLAQVDDGNATRAN